MIILCTSLYNSRLRGASVPQSQVMRMFGIGVRPLRWCLGGESRSLKRMKFGGLMGVPQDSEGGFPYFLNTLRIHAAVCSPRSCDARIAGVERPLTFTFADLGIIFELVSEPHGEM